VRLRGEEAEPIQLFSSTEYGGIPPLLSHHRDFSPVILTAELPPSWCLSRSRTLVLGNRLNLNLRKIRSFMKKNTNPHSFCRLIANFGGPDPRTRDVECPEICNRLRDRPNIKCKLGTRVPLGRLPFYSLVISVNKTKCKYY
jgi:hypothetical protein